MRLIPALLLSCCTIGTGICAEDPQAQEGEDRYGKLEQDESAFKETWVNPDIDWTRFDSLYLWSAEFQYRDVGPARRTRSTLLSTRQREFGISDADREKFEQAVSDVFVDEIQKAANFKVTEELTPRTLIMRAGVLDIVSFVPPDLVGPNEIYMATFGEATLVLELIDAQTGEVAALVAERRALQPFARSIDLNTMPTNPATVMAEVRRWARRAANTLRSALDDAIAGN